MPRQPVFVPDPDAPHLAALPMAQERSAPVRAAQYIRMSTDNQQYSPANQRDAIAKYAADHGMVVVRTYADEGAAACRLNAKGCARC